MFYFLFLRDLKKITIAAIQELWCVTFDFFCRYLVLVYEDFTLVRRCVKIIDRLCVKDKKK